MAKKTKLVEETAQVENPQVKEQVNEVVNETAAEEKAELQDLNLKENLNVAELNVAPATEERRIMPNISVVFPFLRDQNHAKGSLKLAIAAFKKFLIHQFNIVVIGDREDWMGKEITVIDYESVAQDGSDEVAMLMLAITHDEVAPTFVWAKPNSYPVSAISLADLLLPKHLNKSSGFCVRKDECDFNTPIPVVFEKEAWVDLFEENPELQSGNIDLLNEFFRYILPDGYVPLKLDWKSDCWYLPVISEKPNEAVLNDFLKHKKFITHNATAATEWLFNKISDIINDAR